MRGLLVLLLGMVSILSVSCDATLLRPVPLLGEGPPPGYIGGDIPAEYQGLQSPFTLQNQGALQAGSQLYSLFSPSCASCHGPDGRGNGPRAPYLEPAPADYAGNLLLTAFRDNKDYIFWWVSEGVDKTSMPAWKSRMSETERWQVITFAWYLGEQGVGVPARGPASDTGRRYGLR